jgi:hypothetical protein
MGFRPILSLGTEGHDADPFAQAIDMSALFGGGPSKSAAGQFFDPEAPIGTWGLDSNPLPMDFLASLGDADLSIRPVDMNGLLDLQPTDAPPVEAINSAFSWPGIPSELQCVEWPVGRLSFVYVLNDGADRRIGRLFCKPSEAMVIVAVLQTICHRRSVYSSIQTLYMIELCETLL